MKPILETIGKGWREFTPTGATPSNSAALMSRDAADDFDVPQGPSQQQTPPRPAPPPQPPSATTSLPPRPTPGLAATKTKETEKDAMPEDFAELHKLIESLNEALRQSRDAREQDALERRIARAKAKLDALQHNNKPMAATRDRRCDGIWARVRATPEIKKLVGEVKTAWRAWQSKCDELDKAGLLPGSAVRRIHEIEQEAIGKCNCPTSMTECAARIAALKSISPAMTRQASIVVNRMMAQIAIPATRLFVAADARLVEILNEAVEDEKRLFSSHGVPHTDTEITRRIVAARAVLADYKSRVKTLTGDDDMHPTANRSWALPLELCE